MENTKVRIRGWCITLNNWTEEEREIIVQFIECSNIQYAIIGQEIGDEGTPHLQGYINFKNAQNGMSLFRINKRIHWEPAKGSPIQNFTYCSKDGIFEEFGTRPKGQGKRSDIDCVRELVKEGTSTRKELYEIAGSYQAFRFGEIGLGLFGLRRSWKTRVIWCYGSTGTGKSHWAHKNYPDAWVSGQVLNGFAFSGYSGEESVILEDFRPQDMTFALCLKVFDKYALSVRTIGGSCQFVARTIVVTTTKHPNYFYNAENRTDEDIGQLLRRIDELKKFDTKYVAKKFEHKTQNTEVGGNTDPH